MHSTKVDYELLCKLNNLLHEECVKNGIYFIDNSAVTERDFWKDGVHMVESGKCLVANNFICHLNNFFRVKKPSYMELVNKKKSSGEDTSANEPMSESVSDSQIAQNNSFSNLDLALYNLQLLKQKYHSNPFISYLNINALSNKINALRQVCKICPLEILYVDETKLDSIFLNSQFRIDLYIPQPPPPLPPPL